MKIKLIMGMFKMEECELYVTNNRITLSTSKGCRTIQLSDIENISLTRHIGRNTRFEINLTGEALEGIFVDKSDAEEFANSLKDSMGAVLQIDFQGQ